MRVSAREQGEATAGRRIGPPLASPSPSRLAELAPWLATAARLLLAGVWIWAAVAKIVDPDASVRAVRAYQLLPEGLVQLTGWGLPFLELGLAVLLLAGLATRFAAVLSALLLVVFMVGIASAWARGLQIDCGCFGGGGADPTAGAGTYLLELARDLGLVVVACLLAVWPRSRFALDSYVLGASDDDRAGDDRAGDDRAGDDRAGDDRAGRDEAPWPHHQDSEGR
jgi:uncharacterized membrane protein YphA (DoxX/SURF4 family)